MEKMLASSGERQQVSLVLGDFVEAGHETLGAALSR